MARVSSREQGVVLIGVLLFILVTSLAASALVLSHTTQMRREREAQLMFVGDQYRKAITSYYNAVPPGGSRALPASLDALLEDKRFPAPVHHLRRLYPDPMTGKADWDLIDEGRGIIGIRSRSTSKPLKQHGFPAGLESLRGKASYREWHFR